MAAFPGIGLQWFGDRELTDSTFTRPGTVVPSFSPLVIGFHREGALEDSGNDGLTRGPRQTIHAPGNFSNNPGILIEGFYDLFWKNRVHVIPPSRAFGNVVSDVQGEVQIYNSGQTIDDARTVEQIVLTDDTGFNILAGNVSTPFVLGAGQSEVYTYEVLKDGPPTVTTMIDFDLSGFNGVSATLNHSITGTRLVLLGYEPEAPHSEEFEYFTSVLEKLGGVEQRASMRSNRRRMIAYTFRLNDEQGVQLELLLWDWSDKQIGTPFWEHATTNSTAISVNDTTIDLADPTADCEWIVGDLAIIISDPNTFEAVTISAINANSIDVLSPITVAWPAGTVVVPMKVAYIRDGLRENLWVGDGLREFLISFDILGEPTSAGDDSAFDMYRSAPVWEDGLTLRAERYQRTFTKNVIRKQNNKSNPNFVQSTRRANATSSISGFTIYAEDITAVTRLRDWLDARRGRQKAFWLPTSKRDMEVNVDSGATVNPSINFIGWGAHIEANPEGRRDIRIEYVDGSTDYRRVSAAEDFSGGERLTLDSTTSQAFSAANVEKVSFMQLVRQDTDKIKIEHFRVNDVSVNIPLKEVTEA